MAQSNRRSEASLTLIAGFVFLFASTVITRQVEMLALLVVSMAIMAIHFGALRRVGLFLVLILPTVVLLLIVYGVITPAEKDTLRIGPLRYSPEGLQQGYLFSLRLLALGATTITFFAIVSPLSIARFLYAYGVSEEVCAAVLASCTLQRHASVRIRKILDAQRSRGFQARGIRNRLIAYCAILRPLVFSLVNEMLERTLTWKARSVVGGRLGESRRAPPTKAHVCWCLSSALLFSAVSIHRWT